MKRTKLLIVGFVCLLLLGMAVFAAAGRRPYRRLEASEIASATVLLSPPGKTIQITDLDKLAGYLRDVVIYNKDNSYPEYAGQGVIFTLTMVDGTQTEVMAYNPFLVIDGVGYRTKYEPCEALNAYANRLLEDEDAVIILEEPPALAVISDETSCGALLGSYTWQRKNRDGTFTALESEGEHPLVCEPLLVPLDTAEAFAALRFTEPPDAVLSVRCWSDEHWSDPTAASEAVVVDGFELALKPGGYIYEVRAVWNQESGCGGTASYSFYVKSIH